MGFLTAYFTIAKHDLFFRKLLWADRSKWNASSNFEYPIFLRTYNDQELNASKKIF